jgi:hypothetical protein
MCAGGGMTVWSCIVHLLIAVGANVWVYRKVVNSPCRHEQMSWGYLSIYTTTWLFVAVLMLGIVVSRLMYGVPKYIQ